MSRRRADVDAVLAALGPEGERVVRSWLATLGVALEDCPSLALVLEIVAVVRVAADVRRTSPALSRSDATRRAAEMLGLEDDTDAAAHPADAYARTLRRWRSRRTN
jgi:hypothetical protein